MNSFHQPLVWLRRGTFKQLTPFSRAIVIVSLALALPHSALSANGVFITKPNPWDPSSQIDETKFFTNIEDHTNYVTFTFPNGTSEQVDKGVLTALIYEPVIPANIQNDADLADVINKQSELQKESAAHPTARLYLGKWLSSLTQTIASYKSRKPRTEGIADNRYQRGTTNSTQAPSSQTQPSSELITADGKHYQNFTVSRVEPDGLILVTDSGIEKVPFTVLSKEMQTKYGYDPTVAAAYGQQEAAVQHAAYQAQEQQRANDAAANQGAQQAQDQAKLELAKMARAHGICVRIHQVTADGVIVDESSEDWNGGIPTGVLNGKRIFVYGTIPGATEDNYWIMKAYRDGSYTFTDTSGASRTMEKWVFVSGKETKTVAP